MKRRLNWQIALGLVLILLSVIFYLIHYAIFRDARHIFLYLIGDIAFVFIEVLLVTLVIHQILDLREKKALLNKMNMVIGAFFSEVGTALLKMLSIFDGNSSLISRELVVNKDWTDKKFIACRKLIMSYGCVVDSRAADLEALKDFLAAKRGFLLRLLENQNLLEHETFTDLLWAIFHLTDELVHRDDVTRLPLTDLEHLSGDIKRAYISLLQEWLGYMKHLKKDYPYLFSLAARTNPFDEHASVEVR